MPRAVLRCALWLALASVCVTGVVGVDAQARTLPARPGNAAPPGAALPTVKIAGIDCISLVRAAEKMGLRVATRERGRAVVITGTGTRAEIQADTRDIRVNGTRVFLGNPVYFQRGQLYVSRIDFTRCLAPLLRPGHGVAVPLPPKLIVLDPGHGGRDHGKINTQLGVNEKTFTLDTALRVKKLLEADGYRVVLTRDDDRFLELAQRPAIANRAGADLFISIHFNALAADTRTSGVEVYTFAPQYQRSTSAWMPGQKDDAQPTPEPANQFDYWNSLISHTVHRSFVTKLKASDRGKKLMHLGVLRSLNCPGTLVECGFLSSDVEARKIATPAYRQQIAEALRDGVRQYTEIVAAARQRRG